jgi:hypothetical protein
MHNDLYLREAIVAAILVDGGDCLRDSRGMDRLHTEKSVLSLSHLQRRW